MLIFLQAEHSYFFYNFLTKYICICICICKYKYFKFKFSVKKINQILILIFINFIIKAVQVHLILVFMNWAFSFLKYNKLNKRRYFQCWDFRDHKFLRVITPVTIQPYLRLTLNIKIWGAFGGLWLKSRTYTA